MKEMRERQLRLNGTLTPRILTTNEGISFLFYAIVCLASRPTAQLPAACREFLLVSSDDWSAAMRRVFESNDSVASPATVVNHLTPPLLSVPIIVYFAARVHEEGLTCQKEIEAMSCSPLCRDEETGDDPASK